MEKTRGTHKLIEFLKYRPDPPSPDLKTDRRFGIIVRSIPAKSVWHFLIFPLKVAEIPQNVKRPLTCHFNKPVRWVWYPGGQRPLVV